MNRIVTVSFFFVVVWMGALFAFAPPLSAQILLPEGYEGTCHITNQEWVGVHHPPGQCLVLSARYQFEAVPDRPVYSGTPVDLIAPPKRLAWIVPLRGEATLPEAPAAGMLEDLYELTHPSIKSKYRLRTSRPRAINRFGENIFSDSRTSDEATATKWTLLEGSGVSASAALEEWARTEGFVGLDEGLAKEYAEAGWTFAVGVTSNPLESGVLGPATFVFSSEEFVLPLRFQAGAGEFDLALYVASSVELERNPLRTWRVRGINAWENLHREAWFQGSTTLGKAEVPESFNSFLDFARGDLLPDLPGDDLHFYVWEAERLNGYGKTTATQKEDFALPQKGK